MELEKQLAGKEECLRELEQLRKEAAAGRLWLARLREEVVRLGCLADKEMEPEALRAITDKLDGQELETLKKTYARRAGDRFPLKTQLEYGETWAEKRDQDGAFLNLKEERT